MIPLISNVKKKKTIFELIDESDWQLSEVGADVGEMGE